MPADQMLYNEADYINTAMLYRVRTVSLADQIMPDDHNVQNDIIIGLYMSYYSYPPQNIRYIPDNPLGLTIPEYWVWSSDLNDMFAAASQLMYEISDYFGDPYVFDYDWAPLQTVLSSYVPTGYGDYVDSARWNTFGDWMRRIIALILRYVPIPPPPLPSIVGETYADWAIAECYQRKTFYALGLYWVFYLQATDVSWDFVYRTSADGQTWSDAVAIVEDYYGNDFSLCFDGTYIHLTRTAYGLHQVRYMRGEPKDDGTITWTSDWVVAVDYSESGGAPYLEKITVDSNGYPWVIYSLYDPWNVNNRIGIIKSTTKDGTWVNDTGFPYEISIENPFYYNDWQGDLAPLTNGKMYAAYGMYDYTVADKPVRGKLWDGSSWGSEEYPCTDYGNMYTQLQIIPEGDDVHMERTSILISPAKTFLIYNKRDHGSSSWSADYLLHTYTGGIGTNIEGVPSINYATGTLYVLFACTGDHNVYYKRCIGGVWDEDATILLTETDLLDWYELTAYNNAMNGQMAVIYTVEIGSYDYLVKHYYFTPD
jgi:hypothetical protein